MSSSSFLDDEDPIETKEWLDAFESVIDANGKDRAKFLLEKLLYKASLYKCNDYSITTPYRNSIPISEEAKSPGNLALEERIRALIRWNAAAMVVRANNKGLELGGHIGSFASAAHLYDIGFNHFWNAPTKEHDGDLIFVQGHCAPGIYARSYLEGKLTEQQIDNFRQEVDGKGVSSYPHSWLMPDYWQFPTVSMGLGPLQAIYQARFTRYLEARGIKQPLGRKVWCFCGDGEMGEPESLGALSIASRENLDNLIFVVNCNLQRLDGPVYGNGKIIQELEGVFRGAGWNVLKVVWGTNWDPLLAKDKHGILQKRMEESCDGEYQNYKLHGGKYTRENFFGASPELEKMVANLSDDDIWRLKRGGHDAQKVFAAYHNAINHKGQPTVILAKTVKGYGLGSAGEAMNTSHNTKKMAIEELKAFRDRFSIPVSDQEIEKIPFYRPKENSPEIKYLKAQRKKLGGSLPARRKYADETLKTPGMDSFKAHLEGTKDREISTTMTFVRILSSLCKDKQIGRRVVPIVPDEARTFGMEGLFRQLGIYSSAGQKYTPVDANQIMYYKEATDGQILEEGINEAGSFCSWLAAGTSYSTNNITMVPFYIYYSMFGFQRIGDLAWAAGDSRARGFLIGGTSGRTTLNGEGLQHQDGHSHVLAGTIPNCVTYDPTFNFELAVIIQDGLKRMIENKEDVFYYITTMNENYLHPAMPKGAEAGIIKGIYKFKSGSSKGKLQVQLLGCGSILREVIEAASILEKDFEVDATIWSVTSFNNLAEDGRNVTRTNMLNPEQTAKKPYITACLENEKGPVIAATDYIKQYPEQLRAFIPQEYSVLGTDGFGRSDSRENLRSFFEVDRYYIVITALKSLADRGEIEVKTVVSAMKKYKISNDKPNPLTV